MSKPETLYVPYNLVGSYYWLGDDYKNLEKNTVNGSKSTVFPLNIYKGQVFPLSEYICESGPRDSTYDYLIDSERSQHPDAPSRFGYARCFNGYCSGHRPGRYNTNPQCIPDTDSQPRDMAPKRFYTDKYQSPFMGDTPTYSKSLISRRAK
jgi:hypothetical protein